MTTDSHWRWRYRFASVIADRLEMSEMGVNGIYLIGSTKKATAGMASDIDLLIHYDGDPVHKRRLMDWLNGWSLALAEFNFQLTGCSSDGLLDVHLITDQDIEDRSCFAVMIDSLDNRARPLRLSDL